MQRLRASTFFTLIWMAIFSGAVSPLGKIALEAFDSFTLVALRFVIGLLVFIPFIRISPEEYANLKRHWRPLLWIGFIAALNPIIFFTGLKFTTASIPPFIYAMVPVLTALHLYFFQKKKLPAKTWWGGCFLD